MLNAVDASLDCAPNGHPWVCMNGSKPVRVVRLLDRRTQFAQRVLRRKRLICALGDISTAGHKLYEIRPQFQLFTRCTPDLLFPVGYPAYLPSVATGHYERLAAGEHPRPRKLASIDAVTKVNAPLTLATQVSDGSDAFEQAEQRIMHTAQCQGHRRQRGPRLKATRLAPVIEVIMVVHKPWREILSGNIDYLRALKHVHRDITLRADVRDPIAFYNHGLVRDRLSARSIDYSCTFEKYCAHV
jgi:hypothetical protein